MMRLLHLIIEFPLVLLLLKLTLLLSFGWIIHRMLRKGDPRRLVILWRTTLACAFLIATLAFLPTRPVVNVIRDDNALVNSISTSPALEPVSYHPAVIQSKTQLAADSLSNEVLSANKLNQSIPVPKESTTTNIFKANWMELIFVVWASIAVLLFVGFLDGHWRSARLVRSASAASFELQAMLRDACKAIGCEKSPRLLLSPEIKMPLITGLFKHAILLPQELQEKEMAADIQAILLHELQQARSHDTAWNQAFGLLAILLWFHPLAWRMRRAHNAACEAVCDAAAASCMGDADAYSRALARVALRSGGWMPAMAGIPMARHGRISQRLKLLQAPLHVHPLNRRRMATALALGILLAGLAGGLHVAYSEEFQPISEKKTELTRTVLVIVTDELGQPVADAPVLAWQRLERKEPCPKETMQPDDPKILKKTDSAGRVTFENLKEGFWFIFIDDPRFAKEWDRERAVQLPVNTEELPLKIKLYAPRTLVGDIINERNQPVSGVDVIVCGERIEGKELQGDMHQDLQISRTDEKGRFQLSRLRPGCTASTANGIKHLKN